MSNASSARGATGVVIDGSIRDGRLVREIEGFSAFARYTSPIASLRRSRIHDIEVPVSMTGTLTSQVRVDPGDWIFGDEDGVLVIPAGALDEVLAKSEEAKDIEDEVREEVQAGVPVIDVYNKYGRLWGRPDAGKATSTARAAVKVAFLAFGTGRQPPNPSSAWARR
jgi:regulator of RNase E activity RraA